MTSDLRHERKSHPTQPPTAAAAANANSDRTSQTDDERIKAINVLPPPEHLIRFFPIRGTPVES
jgi:3-deoxy-7-phosphoheptulonate synthase